MIARDATRFEKDAQARDVTLFWRRAPSSAEPACVSPTDYLYIVDLKKNSSRIPLARLLSPDARKYLCGSKQSFEEGGGVRGVNECQLFVVYGTHNLL